MQSYDLEMDICKTMIKVGFDGSSVFSKDLAMSIRSLQLYTIASVWLLMVIVFSSGMLAIRELVDHPLGAFALPS